MAIILKDKMDVENFDILSIDISEFEDVINSIPQDGNVDLAIAEELATKFLRAADRCSEIIAQINWFYQKKKDFQKKVYAEACLIRAKEKGYTKVAEKNQYGFMDEEYLAAAEETNRAEVAKKYFETKLDSFKSAHWQMRAKLKSETSHKSMAGFNGRDDASTANWEDFNG
jgi:hypothetical protein